MTALFTRTIDKCEVALMVVESMPVRTATETLAVQTTPDTEVVRTLPQRIETFTAPETIYASPQAPG